MAQHQVNHSSPIRNNFFSGSPLNRLAWLRTSNSFLNAIAASPSTRWVLFNAGSPLVSSATHTLARFSTSHIHGLLEPKTHPGDDGSSKSCFHIYANSEDPLLQGACHIKHPIVFLGLEEPPYANGALASSHFADPERAVETLKGTPYFALDVSELLQSCRKELVQNLVSSRGQFIWADPVRWMGLANPFEAAIFAMGRTMTDWILRNKFCAGCGSTVYSTWGGWKLSCSSLLPGNVSVNYGQVPCITTHGVHNFSHPRTDPAVIVLIIDETGERALLGKSYHQKDSTYSPMSGFMEPGESVEDAIAREAWEETGIKIANPQYHSNQPWPYPADIMLGYYARADSSQTIRIDLDNELEDARWFTRAQILAIISQSRRPQALTVKRETGFFIPPETTIAGMLVRDWAEGRVKMQAKGVKAEPYYSWPRILNALLLLYFCCDLLLKTYKRLM